MSRASPQLLNEGDTIGAYRIVRLLGAGGMGEVYLARQDRPIQRDVAIKVVSIAANARGLKRVLDRFDRERQTLSRLEHPNIARVIDAGQAPQGWPYVVMEFVDGQPINRFADGAKLDLWQRLELFLQVCDGIEHAHTKTIIHRDIKPGNTLVLLNRNKPLAKVIDFGLAKALDPEEGADNEPMTVAGTVVGTYEYMSPEQTIASPDIDTRSDVYSLGVMLYELLIGVRPFERTLRADGRPNTGHLFARIREEAPLKPSERLAEASERAKAIAAARGVTVDQLRKILSSDLEWIPLRALLKKPDDRYGSVRQLGDDIRNFLNGWPVEAAPASRLYRVKKWVARHRAAVGITTATAALVVAFGVLLVVMYARTRGQMRQLLASEQQLTAAKTQGTNLDSDLASAKRRISQLAAELDQLKKSNASLLATNDALTDQAKSQTLNPAGPADASGSPAQKTHTQPLLEDFSELAKLIAQRRSMTAAFLGGADNAAARRLLSWQTNRLNQADPNDAAEECFATADLVDQLQLHTAVSPADLTTLLQRATETLTNAKSDETAKLASAALLAEASALNVNSHDRDQQVRGFFAFLQTVKDPQAGGLLKPFIATALRAAARIDPKMISASMLDAPAENVIQKIAAADQQDVAIWAGYGQSVEAEKQRGVLLQAIRNRMAALKECPEAWPVVTELALAIEKAASGQSDSLSRRTIAAFTARSLADSPEVARKFWDEHADPTSAAATAARVVVYAWQDKDVRAALGDSKVEFPRLRDMSNAAYAKAFKQLMAPSSDTTQTDQAEQSAADAMQQIATIAIDRVRRGLPVPSKPH